jgi:hypothetical protein
LNYDWNIMGILFQYYEDFNMIPSWSYHGSSMLRVCPKHALGMLQVWSLLS